MPPNPCQGSPGHNLPRGFVGLREVGKQRIRVHGCVDRALVSIEKRNRFHETLAIQDGLRKFIRDPCHLGLFRRQRLREVENDLGHLLIGK